MCSSHQNLERILWSVVSAFYLLGMYQVEKILDWLEKMWRTEVEKFSGYFGKCEHY